MTTTSVDAAQTLPVRLPARTATASHAAPRRSPREVVAYPVLLIGLGAVGLGYLAVAWLMLSWVIGLVS